MTRGTLRVRLLDAGAKPLGRATGLDSPLFGKPHAAEVLLLDDGSAFVVLGDQAVVFSLLSRLEDGTRVQTQVFPADTKHGAFGYAGGEELRTFQSLQSDDLAASLAGHRKLVEAAAAQRRSGVATLARLEEYEAMRATSAAAGAQGCRQLLAVALAGAAVTLGLLAWKAPLLVTIVAALPVTVFWALWIAPWILARRTKKP